VEPFLCLVGTAPVRRLHLRRRRRASGIRYHQNIRHQNLHRYEGWILTRMDMPHLHDRVG
jgi:hypothetical protein